ncbi:Ca(2+)-dependent cysteine protease, partial [Dimargaris xerosporica]
MYPGGQYQQNNNGHGGGFMPMPGGDASGQCGYPPPSYGPPGGGMNFPTPSPTGGGNGMYPPAQQAPYPPMGGGYPPPPSGNYNPGPVAMPGGGYPPPLPAAGGPTPTQPPPTGHAHYQPHHNPSAPALPARHNNHASVHTHPPPLHPGGSAQWGTLYQQGHNVQLSHCNGRKRALLIGINYIGQSQALKGCINDVRNIKRFLIELFNFREADMVILTDDAHDPQSQPTRANIIRGMNWLVSGAQPNDSFFFHFSGHGSQVKDSSGDEIDGYDETILPVDYKYAGQIVDDEMNAIMVRRLPQGARLTAIFDSCHSGTALDLPFVYDHRGRLVQNQVSELATKSLMSAGGAYLSGDILTAGKSVFSGLKTMVSGSKIQKRQKDLKGTMGDVIMFSGCKDSQTSADTFNYVVGNTGAMSHAFVTVLRSNPRQSYTQLLHSTREYLRQNKYKQVPQLSTGRHMDMNQVFI